jgi:hypothetical protein
MRANPVIRVVPYSACDREGERARHRYRGGGRGRGRGGEGRGPCDRRGCLAAAAGGGGGGGRRRRRRRLLLLTGHRCHAHLELLQLRSVHDALDDLPHLHVLLVVCGYDTQKLLGRVEGWRRSGGRGDRRQRRRAEVGDHLASEAQGVRLVGRQVVSHARGAAVHVGATQVLRADLFAGRGLDKGRTTQEDGPLALHHDRLVRHRRHVRAARGA